MFAPAYNQYSMQAPEPAYYNPILESVLSPAFLQEEYNSFQMAASYTPAKPQPAPYNDAITSQLSSFSWPSASTSLSTLRPQSPPPPTQRELAHIVSPYRVPNRCAFLFPKPSDAPQPDSGVVVPTRRKRTSRRALPPLRVPSSLIVPAYPPPGYETCPPAWDWEPILLEWAPLPDNWDEALWDFCFPAFVPEADPFEPAEISFGQQIWDQYDSQVDVEVHATVNSSPLDDEENVLTHYIFDLPTGSGQSQSSGRSGAGHVAPRLQQGQSKSEEGLGFQGGNKTRKCDDSQDADAELDSPFLPQSTYRPIQRRHIRDIFIPYQPKREEVPRSKGKRKAGDREDDEQDSRARKTVRLAPEWESVEH